MDKILDLFPIKLCEHELLENMVVVLYKDKNPSFIERIFFKKLSEKPYKIDLDEVGSFIWLLCDGKFSVSEIIEKSKIQFGDLIAPAENRVTEFITQLRSKKLIELYHKVDKSKNAE